MNFNKRSAVVLFVLTMGLAIFCIDLVTPAGSGEFFLYLIPMLMTDWVKNYKFSIAFGLLCTVFTIVGFFFPFLPPRSEMEMAVLRRAMGLFVLWAVTAYLAEKQRAEAVIQENDNRFRAFMNNSSALAWMKDEKLNYVYLNDRLAQLLDRPAAEVQGRNLTMVWNKKVAEQLRMNDLTVLHSDKALEFHEQVPLPDGTMREMLVSKFPFIDRHGRKFVGGVALDITESKHSQEQLRNSERRFRSVWENSADGMRLTNEEGVIVAVNPPFCQLVERAGREMEGKLISEVKEALPEGAREEYRQRFARRDFAETCERQITLKSGRVLDLELHHVFIELEHEPPLLLTTFRDLSEQRQHQRQQLALERKLMEAAKLESLGILAGGIAHDFNNLLTGILGNTGLAIMQMSELAPAHGNLENIEKLCLQAADLCKQMLAYSGRGRFVIQKLDLNKLIEEMTQLLRISIARKVVLKFDLASQLPAVEVDATQMRQVLMNLIINGSEAIGDRSGVISVHTGVMRADKSYLAESYSAPGLQEGDYVFAEISDSGCGMSPETKAKVFDPFFTTKFTGRGLGLAAVLGIMRGHKGGIKIYSEAGKGSTFKVFLPCAGPLPDPSAAPSSAPKWRGSGNILVVDDEEHVRAVVARMLESFGFQVTLARDGREGLETFRKLDGQIAAVLLDMTMPHLNGEEAFRELRRIRADVPVLLMSGYNEQDLTSRFLGKGLDGFLQKPFKPDDLREKLREILSRLAET